MGKSVSLIRKEITRVTEHDYFQGGDLVPHKYAILLSKLSLNAEPDSRLGNNQITQFSN